MAGAFGNFGRGFSDQFGKDCDAVSDNKFQRASGRQFAKECPLCDHSESVLITSGRTGRQGTGSSG